VEARHVLVLPAALATVTLISSWNLFESKPQRNGPHLAEAGGLLSLAIACSYFFAVSSSDVFTVEKEIPGIRSLNTVIAAIRKDLGLKEEQILVLVVQLDEFQRAPYVTLCMMRYLSGTGYYNFVQQPLGSISIDLQLADSISDGLFPRSKCVIVPVLSGTASGTLGRMRTQLFLLIWGRVVHLGPLSKQIARRITVFHSNRPDPENNTLFDLVAKSQSSRSILV
jgi:hypothetical protein